MSADYDKRYPPDRPGEEANDDARVWRVYRDRAADADEDIIGGWHKTLDVLLIFAGLFSAVSTAFLLEVQKQLEADSVKYLTTALLAVLRNQPITGDIFSPTKYKSPLTARWVTALWLVSLVIALIVALLAILVKQWLGEYSSRMRAPAASHRHWATRHITLHSGLDRWKLDAFISGLPVALHLSLFLFLAGLVMFFWSLSLTMAVCTLAMTSSVLAFYIATLIAPLISADCPTQTPLLDQSKTVFDIVMRKLRPHNQATDLPTSLSSNETFQQENALSWMVTTLPAVEDLHVAIAAIGCLDYVNRDMSQASSLCEERVVSVLARCTADLLDSPLQHSNSWLGKFLRARIWMQRRWDTGNAGALIPALPPSYRPAPHLPAEIALVAHTLRDSESYPRAFNEWLRSEDRQRPYQQSSLLTLVQLHNTFGQTMGPLAMRLQLPLRLLAYEMVDLAETSVSTAGIGHLEPLLDLLHTDLVQLKREEHHPVGVSSDIRVRCIHIAGRVLSVLNAERGSPEADRYIDFEYLLTLRQVLKSALWLLLCSVSTLTLAVVPTDIAVQCVSDIDAQFGDHNGPWERQALEGLFALFMATSIRSDPRNLTWALGQSMRFLLAQLWLAYQAETRATWIEELVFKIVKLFRVAGDESFCVGLPKQFSEHPVAREICTWLEARDGRPSAWRLAWEISKNDDGANISWVFLQFRLMTLLVALHRSGYNVAALVSEIVGIRPGTWPVSVEIHRRGWDGTTMWHFRHLKEISSPELWEEVLQHIQSVPFAEWQPVHKFKSAVEARDRDTFIATLTKMPPCTLCPTGPIFHPERFLIPEPTPTLTGTAFMTAMEPWCLGQMSRPLAADESRYTIQNITTPGNAHDCTVSSINVSWDRPDALHCLATPTSSDGGHVPSIACHSPNSAHGARSPLSQSESLIYSEDTNDRTILAPSISYNKSPLVNATPGQRANINPSCSLPLCSATDIRATQPEPELEACSSLHRIARTPGGA